MPTKTIDRELIETNVGRMIDEAHSYRESDIEPARTKATDYFMGRPFGNEENGRSQVVLTVVRDTTLSFMRSLMRIFFSAEQPVEYEPRRLETAEQAQQATDYVRLIVTQDNPGFMVTHDAFQDGLVRRLGIIKWYWDKGEVIKGYSATGLTDENLLQLLMDPEVEIEVVAEYEPLTTDMRKTYDAKVIHRSKKGRARIMAVPGEELAWNRDARTLQTARFLVHTRRDMRFDELLGLGYTDEELEDATADFPLDSPTTLARRNDGSTPGLDQVQADNKTRLVRYDEAYTYMEVDDDIGVALYKTCHVGPNHTLLGDPELISCRPFAGFCPFPNAHTIEGLGLSDATMDLQLIESQVMRGTLDSLSLALQQDTEVVDGQVNMKDMLNPERGKIIRVRQSGAIREIQHRFLGELTLPILDKLDDIKADRTGQTKASEGLDADVLQSTTKAAVTGTLTKAQQAVEYVARIFGETGYKDLFKGLLQLIIENQDEPRVVRLRGAYVEVDPRSWDASMDVRVNIALGGGLPEDRIAALKEIASDQTNIVATMGPTNPLVTLTQLRNTRAKIVELAGFTSADEFYQRITPEVEAQAAAAANQPKEGDPAAAALAHAEEQKNQIQAQKNEAEFHIKQQELALKEREMLLIDDRERDKQAADVAVRLAEIEAKHQTSVDREAFKSQMESERAALSNAMQERQSQMDLEHRSRKAEMDADTARYKAELDASTKLEIAKATAPINVTVNQPKQSGKIRVKRDKDTGDMTATREDGD